MTFEGVASLVALFGGFLQRGETAPPPIQHSPTMTHLERLKRLRALLKDAREEDQASWHTCLWAQAVSDPALCAAGIPQRAAPGEYGRAFFGYIDIWGVTNVNRKRRLVDQYIGIVEGTEGLPA